MSAGRIPRWTFILLSLCSAGVHAVTLTDDRGRVLTLERPAERIVSLAPNLTELLFEAGAGDRLVGAVAYSDYPPAARRLPRVGEAGRIDIERIVVLQPDLVVAWKTGNSREDYERLDRLGLKVYVVELATIARIPDGIEDLGRLTGTSGAAEASAAAFRRRLDALQRRYAGREGVSVFYQIWEQPLMTVSGAHFISDALRLCGGENIFAALGQLAPSVALEAVIAADPQVVLINASAGTVDAWRRWRDMAAVRLDNLYTIDDDLISRPAPRLLDGVERLCEILDTARGRIRAASPR